MQLNKSLNLVIFLLVILMSAGVAIGRVQSAEIHTDLQYHQTIVDKYGNFLTPQQHPSLTFPHYYETPKYYSRTEGEPRGKRSIAQGFKQKIFQTEKQWFSTLRSFIHNKGYNVKNTLFEEAKKFRNSLLPADFKKLTGLGGAFDFLKKIAGNKAKVSSADHTLPLSVIEHAKEVKELKPGDMGAVMMETSLHEKLISTGGNVDEKIMKLDVEVLEKHWREPLPNNLNSKQLNQARVIRSTYFVSHVAKLLSEGEYVKAFELQVRGNELSLRESITAKTKLQNPNLSELDLKIKVQAEYDKIYPGIVESMKTTIELIKNKISKSDDKTKFITESEEFIKKMNARVELIDVGTVDPLRKQAEDLVKKFKAADLACVQGSSRRSVGGKSCCLCALRKSLPKKKKNEDVDDERKGKSKKGGKGSAQAQLQDTLELKNSLKSGDIVDELAGISKTSGDPNTNNNDNKLIKTNVINFGKIGVGLGSLKRAIDQKLSKIGSSINANVIQRLPKSVRKFGVKAYSGFDKVHKKMGPMNKAFMFRNLAKGIREGDVKSIGITVGMVGAGRLGQYFDKIGKTKGIWKFNQNFVKGAGKLIGFGVDAVGIVFDVISIHESRKCLKQKGSNEANCEMEQKYLNDGTNATALIIILENSTCVDDVDICGGRNAILDIIGSSVSIGLSAVGMACPPCLPVTMVTDFVINRYVEVFQAGYEIAALNKVIPLTEDEIAYQLFRKLTFQGFSAYLTDLKDDKQMQTGLLKSMSSFLVQNEQFSAIIVPKKSNYKCETPTLLKIKDKIGVRPFIPTTWIFPFVPTVGKNNKNENCDITKPGPPEDTIVDLTHLHQVKPSYYQPRWSPDVNQLSREHSLFCPPIIWTPEEETQAIPKPESFCHDAFGLKVADKSKRRATMLHYNMFPPRLSPGKDIAWGYTQSQNVFIFNNTNVDFRGGDEDDLFVVQGCCPTGRLDAGGGIDTLDLSGAKSEARSQGGVRIDLVKREVNFNQMGFLAIHGFEIIIGASNEVESVVVNCELTALNLGGGTRYRMDEITIPSLPECHRRDLTLELGSYTRVDNRGDGRFHWKIQSDVGLVITTTSRNSTHTFELPFCYTEVMNIIFNSTLNMIEMEVDRMEHYGTLWKIMEHFGGMRRSQNRIQIQLLDQMVGTNDFLFFTQTEVQYGSFCPSARIIFTPPTTTPPLLLLISVNVNDPNLGEYFGTMRVKGHPHFDNIFNIAHDETRSRELVVIGGAGRNVFILNGLIRGSLQAGNESNTLDVSAVPKNKTIDLDFNLGMLLYLSNNSNAPVRWSSVVQEIIRLTIPQLDFGVPLFSNNAAVELNGTFQEIIGREKAQDILTLGSHCHNQSTTNIDLRGGESHKSPDIITITSQQNQSSCNQNLTLHLWPHTRLVNRGKGNGDSFIYSVAKGTHDLTLSITETTTSTHAIQLQFTYTDIESIIVGDPNTMTIGLVWGGNISLQGSASGEHILKMNSARLVTDGGKAMDRRRRREAHPTVNTVPPAKLILRGSEPVLEIDLTSENIQSPAAASDQLLPVFKGHSTISNLYLIHPQLHTQISAIWGGTGNDTFVPLSLNSTRLDFISNIASTLNTLDFTQMKDENDTTVVEVDLVHDRVTYTTGNDTRQQVTRGFTYLFGRSNGEDRVIGDSCRTEFIDLGGGGPIDWILIPESDTTCTGDDAVNEMTIVVRGGTRVVIGSISGAYKYDLSLDDDEVSENGLDFRVSCLKQDMSFGLCYGTTQTVQIKARISDFTSIQVLQNQVSLRKTIELTYGQEIVLNFTLEYFNKSEAVTFPASWLSYLPIDSELEGGWFENPGAVSSDEDLDELLVTPLEYRQDTFSFQFLDGATLSINRMNKLTLVQNEPNCKSTSIKRIIEEKILLAFKFQATIVTICDDQAVIILTGGDEEADSLENVPDYETHLVGNMGVESVFKIIPSNLTTQVHLSGTEDTRNILDLTAFYDPDVVISQSDFPSVIEDEDTKDLVLTLGSGQEVVFVQGAYQHEQLSVVLRYTELAFSTFLPSTNETSTNETTREKRAESIREWRLVQNDITFDEEKELVFLSADDFDTDSTIFQMPNGTSSTNSVFRLENDSIMVTRMFGEADPESQSQTIVILDSDRMARGNSSEIKLVFGDAQEPATLVVVVLNEEYVANLRSVQTEINNRILISIIFFSIPIIFVLTLLILFYYVFKHRKRIFKARGGKRNTRIDGVVDCSEHNEMENLALALLSFDITAQEVHYDCGNGEMRTRKHATFTYEPKADVD